MIVLTRYTAVGCEAGSCMGKAAISLKNRDPVDKHSQTSIAHEYQKY